jgi:hypothetical protein
MADETHPVPVIFPMQMAEGRVLEVFRLVEIKECATTIIVPHVVE